MTFMIFLIFYLCISKDEVEVGLVSSEPLKRGATSVISLAPVFELVVDPTPVGVEEVVMEESISFVP